MQGCADADQALTVLQPVTFPVHWLVAASQLFYRSRSYLEMQREAQIHF
jgi:hypothetical protein